MIATRHVDVLTQNMIGVKFSDRVVLVSKTEKPVEDIRFIVAIDQPVRTLIFGLSRDSEYAVDFHYPHEMGENIEAKSDRDGMISFDIHVNGVHCIRVRKRR